MRLWLSPKREDDVSHTSTLQIVDRTASSRKRTTSSATVMVGLLCLSGCWLEPIDRNVYGTCERLNEEGVYVPCAPVTDTGSPGATAGADGSPNPSGVSEGFYALGTRQVYPEPATTVTGSVRFGVDELSGFVDAAVHIASDADTVTNVSLRRGAMGAPDSEQIRFFEPDPSEADTWRLVDQGLLTKTEVHAWTRGQLFVSVQGVQGEVLRAQVVPEDVRLIVSDLTSHSVAAHHDAPQAGAARAFLTVKESSGDSSIYVHTSDIAPTAVQLRQGAIGEVWGDGPEIHVTYQPEGWSTLWSAPNYSLEEDWLFAMQYGRAYVVLYTEDHPSSKGVGALRGLIDLVP